MGQCKQCLLPASAPRAELDFASVCALCRDSGERDHNTEEQLRKQRERDLHNALEDCRGRGEYDCMVCLSGGKDSCYLLYRIKRDFGLNVLAYTVNVNLTDIAWKNIHRTIERLEVPHLTYTPPKDVYRRLFRYLLQNQDPRGAVRTVCYACAPLTEGYAIRTALEKKIPLILAGYSPGQPDADRMVYEFSREMICQTDWTPRVLRECGLFSEEDLGLFWNPHLYRGASFPRFVAPFHAWPYSQAETMRRVVELGLIVNQRHASPIHSNCPVNWLLMYSDLKNLGYNPYAPEFSALIRQGKASRWYWRIMGPIVNLMIRRQILLGRNVRKSFAWLGLRPDDLRLAQDAPEFGSGCSNSVANEATLERVR